MLPLIPSQLHLGKQTDRKTPTGNQCLDALTDKIKKIVDLDICNRTCPLCDFLGHKRPIEQVSFGQWYQSVRFKLCKVARPRSKFNGRRIRRFQIRIVVRFIWIIKKLKRLIVDNSCEVRCTLCMYAWGPPNGAQLYHVVQNIFRCVGASLNEKYVALRGKAVHHLEDLKHSC